MDDQRLTVRLLNYWALLRDHDNLPQFQRFNTGPIEDLWPQCFLLQYDRAHKSFRYEYMGNRIADVYGTDLTGTVFDQRMQHFPGDMLSKKLRLVVDRTEPVRDQGHLVSGDGKLLKYRACFLPFCNHKQELTHIIVGLSLRVY